MLIITSINKYFKMTQFINKIAHILFLVIYFITSCLHTQVEIAYLYTITKNSQLEIKTMIALKPTVLLLAMGRGGTGVVPIPI